MVNQVKPIILAMLLRFILGYVIRYMGHGLFLGLFLNEAIPKRFLKVALLFKDVV